jgi:hypothetical protein
LCEHQTNGVAFSPYIALGALDTAHTFSREVQALRAIEMSHHNTLARFLHKHNMCQNVISAVNIHTFSPPKPVVIAFILPLVVGNHACHNRKDTMDSIVQAAMKVKVSAEEAHAELLREMEVRTRIYDKWVKDGKLSYIDARDRYARMQKALLLVQRAVEVPHLDNAEFVPEVVNA